MNDRELADAVLALGVGKANQIYPDALGKFYQIDTDADWQTSINHAEFVREWRVAGALMEKLHPSAGNRRTVITNPTTASKYLVQISHYFGSNDLPRHDVQGNSLPRAIIEACVAALAGGEEADE